MANSASRATVTTTAAVLVPSIAPHFKALVKNLGAATGAPMGANTVYLGGPDVTVAQGHPFEPGETLTDTDFTLGSPLFAIASGSVPVSVFVGTP